MIVQDTSVVAGLSLASAAIVDGAVKLNFKNGATFTLTPEVEDGAVKSYGMNFINGKENKKITNLQNKANDLLNQIKALTEEGDTSKSIAADDEDSDADTATDEADENSNEESGDEPPEEE